jgi:DNA-directed RNA polymerase alpha subunit
MKLPLISYEASQAIAKAVKERHPVSSLEELGIGQRMINLFQSNGIHDMNDLMHKKRQDLMGMQNFGEKQLFVLFEALSKYHNLCDL